LTNGGSARAIFASLAVGTGRESVRILPVTLTVGAGRRTFVWRGVSLEGLTGTRGREVMGRAGSRKVLGGAAGVGSLLMAVDRCVRVVMLLVDWVVAGAAGCLIDSARVRSSLDGRAGDLFSQLWINCWTLLARGVDDCKVLPAAAVSLTRTTSSSSSTCVKSTTVSVEGGVLMGPLTDLKSDASLSMRCRAIDCSRMSGYSRVK